MRVKSVLNFLKKKVKLCIHHVPNDAKRRHKKGAAVRPSSAQNQFFEAKHADICILTTYSNAMKLFGNLARILMRHTYTNSSSCKHLCLSLALLKFLIFRFKLYTSGIIFVHKCPTELTQFLTLSRSRVNMRKISKNAHLRSHI